MAGREEQRPAGFFGLIRLKVNGNRSFQVFLSSLYLLAQLPTSGCSQSANRADDVTLHYESQPNAPHVGSNTFVVTLAAKNGEPITGARVSMEGDMSHAGMSPSFGNMKEVDGKYRGDLVLGMRGDWILTFHIALANGRTVERQIDIRNVREN